jgi:phage tail tape-measure protein
MAINIELKQFAIKNVPVGADIVYCADSANNFDEVQCTISSIISNYLGLFLGFTAIAGTTQSAAVQNGYVTTNGALTTITLPAAASVGQLISVSGQGAGGWLIQCASGQNIQVGNTSTSTTGSIASTNRYDSVDLICVVANTTWAVRCVFSAGITIV